MSADRTPIIQDPRDFSGADPGLDDIRNLAGERPKSKQVPEKESFTKRFQRFASIDSKIDSGRSQSVQSIKNKGSQVPSTVNSSRKSRDSGGGVRTSLGAKGKKPPTVKGGGLLPPSSKRSSQMKSTEGAAGKEKKKLKLPLIPLSGGSRNGSVSGKQGKNKEEQASTATPTKAGLSEEGHSPESHVSVDSKGRKKFSFADLFKDEGMFHSVNEAPVVKLLRQASNQAGNHGYLRTPLQELEKYELEHLARTLEDDLQYNNTVFDRAAMKQIEKRNKNAGNADQVEDAGSTASPTSKLDLEKLKKPLFSQ